MNDSRNFISTNNTGVVLSFNKDRGFGFIKVDNDGSHVFVHIRDIDTNPADYPEAGDRLCFDVIKTVKGVSAINASFIERA